MFRCQIIARISLIEVNFEYKNDTSNTLERALVLMMFSVRAKFVKAIRLKTTVNRSKQFTIVHALNSKNILNLSVAILCVKE